MSGQCWILSLAVLSAFLMGLLDKIWMIANTDYPLPDQRFKLLSTKKKIVRLKVFKKEKFFFERVSEKSVGDIRILSRDHSSQKMTLSALLSLKISLKGRERRSRTLTFLSRLE